MLRPKNDILQGWKDIACHLGRDVRTVRRWEKQRHLPIRRTQGEGRASVYALTEELNEWLLYSPAHDDSPEETLPEVVIPPLVASAPPTGANRLPILAILGCALLAAGVSTYQLYWHHSSSATTRTSGPYRSSVAGVEELYLRGVYLYEQRTPKALSDARDVLMEVVSKDPSHAPAWAALSSINVMLEQFGLEDPGRAFDDARITASRALELDPSLAEPHASLGFIAYFAEANPSKAEGEFKLALARDPQNVCAHHRYGIVLLQEGRFQEALDHLNMAQHLDPASTVILASRALAMGYTGHRDEAIRMLLPVAAEHPGNPILHARLAALAAMAPMNTLLYVEQRQQVEDLAGHPSPVASGRLLTILHQSGETAMWRALLTEAQANDVSPQWLDIAGAQAHLGDKDAAFATLNYATQRNPLMKLDLRTAPLLNPLIADARFDQLFNSNSAPTLASDVIPALR